MLVLASASPRRADLLRRLGLAFETRPADLDEALPPGVEPAAGARQLARAKAEAVAAKVAEGWVLGADTVVAVDGRILGKPADADEARAMLRALRGRTHRVATGVCVVRQPGARAWDGVEVTRVAMAPLDDATVEAYVATGEPFGKAGGYAVQGIAAAYVEAVEGPVDNVVGLPVRLTLRLLAQAGVPLPAHLRVGSDPAGRTGQA